MRFFTPRYEFELEVIVKAAWRGISVINIPIRVFYPSKEDRVSHFRPLKDFTRISVLNTFLVTIALLYIHPIRFIKAINKENIKNFIKDNITHSNESNLKISMAIGLGFFFGIIPIHMAVFSKYMISGVMGVMFILFLIMGIVSLRNFKLFKKRAAKENNLTAEIRKWCLQNLHKETIDQSLCFDASISEELKYFQRFEIVKKAIQKKFLNLDEAYVERLVEEMYPELFEKQDKE